MSLWGAWLLGLGDTNMKKNASSSEKAEGVVVDVALAVSSRLGLA